MCGLFYGRSPHLKPLRPSSLGADYERPSATTVVIPTTLTAAIHQDRVFFKTELSRPVGFCCRWKSLLGVANAKLAKNANVAYINEQQLRKSSHHWLIFDHTVNIE